MIEYKIDRACDGQDVFFDGKKVGWLSLSVFRSPSEDKRPVVVLSMAGRVVDHDNMDEAKQYIDRVYKIFKHRMTT